MKGAQEPTIRMNLYHMTTNVFIVDEQTISFVRPLEAYLLYGVGMIFDPCPRPSMEPIEENV